MKKKIVLYICTDYRVLAGSSLSLLNMIECLKEFVEPIVLVAWEGPVVDELRNRKIAYIVCPFFYLSSSKPSVASLLLDFRKTRLYSNWASKRKCIKVVRELVKTKNIDLIHSNSSITTIGFDIAKKIGVKHVWHIREFLDLDFGIKVYGGRKKLTNIINKSDARICISNAVYKHWNFIKENSYVVPNAVRPVSSLKYNDKKEKYFLFCAAVVTRNKGAEFAVKSFCMSRLSCENYVLKIVGKCEDEYRQQLISIAKTFNCENNIIFVGYQKYLDPFFEKATALLMCSACEALGRVTVEAMFNGCLVLGFNSGGTKEIIEDKKTGFLFDDISACVNLLRDVSENNYEYIILNSQKYVRQYYTEEYYRDKILSVYNEVLE
ncbi:MAG: glycosyltransferase family 4 protein [Bacteroidales bacterium]|nr:glycosyltransferase family 4 protein [Bacteroidales bacterium]